MLRLHLVLLGGKATGATVELHDVVFIAAEHIEAAYTELKDRWFGIKDSAHLDSWCVVEKVDGYRVTLSPEPPPPASQPSLYFLNIGSYPNGRLEEAHHYVLVTGNSPAEAKEKAKRLAPRGHSEPHKDNQILIDDVTALTQIGRQWIHLTSDESARFTENKIYSKYQPL